MWNLTTALNSVPGTAATCWRWRRRGGSPRWRGASPGWSSCAHGVFYLYLALAGFITFWVKVSKVKRSPIICKASMAHWLMQSSAMLQMPHVIFPQNILLPKQAFSVEIGIVQFPCAFLPSCHPLIVYLSGLLDINLVSLDQIVRYSRNRLKSVRLSQRKSTLYADLPNSWPKVTLKRHIGV